MPDTEQLALRFPVGTRARLRALALPGEPMTSVLIRALAALEAAPALDHGPPPPADRLDDLERRLDDLERRLDGSRPASRSAPTTSRSAREYPESVWAMAVEMKDQGRPLIEISEAMREATGRDKGPNPESLGSRIKAWRGKLGMG